MSFPFVFPEFDVRTSLAIDVQKYKKIGLEEFQKDGQSRRNGEAIEDEESRTGNEPIADEEKGARNEQKESVQGEDHDEKANEVYFIPLVSQLPMFAWPRHCFCVEEAFIVYISFWCFVFRNKQTNESLA